MIPSPTHFFSLDEPALRGFCDEQGMPAFRAKQIASWVYEHGVGDPEAMSNLSKRDRETLGAHMTFLSGRTIAHQVATDGTQKLLIQWGEDAQPTDALAGTLSRSLPILNESASRISGFDYDAGDPTRQTECVMIPSRDHDRRAATVRERNVTSRDREGADSGEPRSSGSGRTHHPGPLPDGRGSSDEIRRGGARKTACISSQVGCPVGCRFCASGLSGLDGNLSAGRIVEQVWRLQQLPEVGRISNVVFMGMGEPLANFAPVTDAIRTLTRPLPFGMGISARKITVSTVGMHKAIERLAVELDLPVTLALSLHAPTDELRRELIPWAEFTTIEQLLAACERWFKKTGREITLEYTLLRRVNDRPTHAEQLAALAKKLRANVNLIRYNEVGGLPYERPEDRDVHRFQEILRERGIKAHIRASRGRDIAAACGQLRHETAAS